jgi:uncharacterized membrane protein
MSDDRKQSLVITAYKGRDTADKVYDLLRGLEKQKLQEIDIKTAAVVYRKNNGKLKLVHKRRVTVKKGAFGGAAVALLVAGTGGGAVLAGAVIGAVVGASRSGQRRDVKKFLDDKLGPDDSALVVLVKDADWASVQGKVDALGFDGEDLLVELTPDAEAQLAAIADDEQVTEAVAEEVEVEDEDVAE